LARVWSASVAEAMARAVLAHQALERERKLHAGRITPRAELEKAEAEHRAACQPLRTFGFSEEQVAALESTPEEPVLLDVRSPFSGEIVERHATLGELIEAGKPLFTVADRSTMWAMLSIPEAALPQVRVGQSVELRLDALPDKTFAGRLTWISAEVDERTRMARARAEVPDPDRELRARMYARARILLGATDAAVLVPESALQRIADRPVVFVPLETDLFEARVVRPGPRAGGMIQIKEGLQPGERVVVSGAFAAKSQFLLSRLGAGCAHE
jgi:cobalt-zinc-cadmium efflux system membrane fusion protein